MEYVNAHASFTYVHMIMIHYTGGVYTSDISATDADGFYDMITYSIDNDYDGIFIINSVTGELSRTSNESVPAPSAVSNDRYSYCTMNGF